MNGTNLVPRFAAEVKPHDLVQQADKVGNTKNKQNSSFTLKMQEKQNRIRSFIARAFGEGRLKQVQAADALSALAGQ